MQKDLQKYYVKYKPWILPVALFSASFFIVFRIIVPQFSSISDTKNSISDKQGVLDRLTTTYQTLSAQDPTRVDDQLKTVNTALPTAKDIAGIFSAILDSASKAGVSLGGFSIKVGGIYGKAAVESTVSGAFPALAMEIKINAKTASELANFSDVLQKKLPISEIKTFDFSRTTGSIGVNFFYKPTDLAIISKQDKVAPLTPQEQKLLDTLETYK